MPELRLSYDDANLWSAQVGKGGATPTEWNGMLARVRSAKREVQKQTRRGELGFFQLPFDRKGLQAADAMARLMSKRFTDLVVLGIGGSDLGARALIQSLVDTVPAKRKRMRLHFAGATTDPTELTHLLEKLDLKKTCFNVVSKSGDTLEPMSAFLIVRDRLIAAVGAKQMPKHIVATTDPTDGSLRALAKREGYATLSIPKNVGGRFSVLSAVGLFPAAAAGIHIAALLSGARTAVDAFHELSASQCPACRFAGVHALGAEKRKQTIQVTMAYSAQLSELGRWVRQLVAESLGKKKNRRGKTVHVGLTPVNCVGPEDQHSQLQLWNEGPADKIVTFLEIKRFGSDLRTPLLSSLSRAEQGIPSSRSLTDLIHLQRQTTAEALRQNGRPNGTIVLDRLDAETLGQLILFFEASIALLGELWDINAYDQPGVELSKQLVRASLSS